MSNIRPFRRKLRKAAGYMQRSEGWGRLIARRQQRLAARKLERQTRTRNKIRVRA